MTDSRFNTYTNTYTNTDTNTNININLLIKCGPCQMMQPVLEDLASRLEDQARIAKVDTDKSPRLASRYQVEALPTLILFHKGKVIEKYIGYKSADELEQEIKKYLKTVE